MRTIAATFVVGAVLALAAAGAASADVHDRQGLVYRYYAGAGLKLQPLLSFSNLEQTVSRGDAPATRRLAAALLAHAVRRGGSLYWPYDFSFGGGPPSWTSGFTQAVAASSLARAAALLRDPSLTVAAARAFRGLRESLLLTVPGGGHWIREYSFTGQVILNAQLESVLELERYARLADNPAAARLAADLERTSARLLPQFDLGCWGRYQLGGLAADAHYEAYHVDLLRRLAASHSEPVWRDTYRRWKRCLGGSR
jgi:hypothetical protein